MSDSRRLKEIQIVEVAIRSGDLQHQKEQIARFENLTWQEVDKQFISLIDATEALQMKRTSYVRSLALEGRIEGVRLQYRGYTKWHIDIESLSYYLQNKRQRSSVRRYILRCHSKDLDVVQLALNDEVEKGTMGNFTIEPAYKRKGTQQS